jgi:ribosome biogenesis GTPase / thiamine phosphate phosphatase
LTFTLAELGWKPIFQEGLEAFQKTNKHLSNEWSVGRVAIEHKGIYRIYCEHGELLGRMSGKMLVEVEQGHERPAVGDWVIIAARPNEGQATLHAVLPRFSKFSRKVAGTSQAEQIVATNVDTVFLVMALNKDFNVRRLERYLLTAWDSGANPVVVLSKADLCEEIEEKCAEVEQVAFGVPTYVVSAATNQGIEELKSFFKTGETTAFLGSSGVGKSTLINRLYGQDILKTNDIREEDDKGRHTTTHRELLVLEGGGIVIDTPGMRELQLWDVGESLSQGFEDIETLAEQCKFRDCSHCGEPGCAVQEAIEDGTLPAERFQSYKKLLNELAYFERKASKKAQAEEKKKWKNISKQMKQSYK